MHVYGLTETYGHISHCVEKWNKEDDEKKSELNHIKVFVIHTRKK